MHRSEDKDRTDRGVDGSHAMLAQPQVDPKKYSSISKGFSTIIKEQGARGLLKGWAPTLVGYSFQGACKFGFYEYFKKYVN